MLQIKKRDNSLTSFNPTKILNRIKKASKGLKVNSEEIFIKVITSMPTEGEITTKELDNLITTISASYSSSHYDYSILASKVSISSFKKNKEIKENFYNLMKELSEDNIINKLLVEKIEKYGIEEVNSIIDYEKDYNFDYFGWLALENIYLLKNKNGITCELPQQMLLRVALWTTKTLEEAKEYYASLSNQLISPATPIMINSGTKNPQLASCVLTFNEEDSREGLLNTLRDISTYSADAAGIGLCMSNIRSKESKINTSGGNAGGLLKYLKIVNESLRFFNQQGRRPGSAAVYIEVTHKDIFDLLDIRKQTGIDELRARDLFTAIMIPDNFMKALEEDKEYYLFCPNDIKKAGLKPFYDIYGEEFEEEYNKAIQLGIGKKVMARDIALKIVESQIETGTPYILFKDNINKKSNHKNIGTIKLANLCSEVVQFTDSQTTAICTLSSMVLKNYIIDKKFNFDLLFNEVRKVVKSLNHVVDINHYSTEKGRKGGLEQRAIGIGVQGLADCFFLLDLIFTSTEAKELNKKIFETIYYSALKESMELCKSGEYKPYEYFKGSPISEGVFQFDMWEGTELSGLWDWDELREDIKKYGVCNSLVTLVMPTASSSRVFNSFEKEEAINSSLFNRKVIKGEVVIVNQYLISDLEKIDLWNENIKNELIISNGSVNKINFQKYLDDEDKSYSKKVKRIEFLKEKYKTIWEIPQKEVINMNIDRGPFIDQTQSMNLYFENPTPSKLLSSLKYSWSKGLKTGNYYIRTKAVSTGAKHLAIDATKTIKEEKNEELELQATIKRELEKNIEKPINSQFECFGCSS